MRYPLAYTRGSLERRCDNRDLLPLGDRTTDFDWLPDAWEIQASGDDRDKLLEITDAGQASGVYDDLTTQRLSQWGSSFHTRITGWATGFDLWEIGDFGDIIEDPDHVTISSLFPSGVVDVTKTDDLDPNDCIGPDDPLTYKICFTHLSNETFTNVTVVDCLPAGVTYPEGLWQWDPNDPFNMIPGDPNYDEAAHTYTWTIGTLDPNQTGCVQITVEVNDCANPGLFLHNEAKVFTTARLLGRGTLDTPVCCWDSGSVIYVKQGATGCETGVDWDNAYTDLQDALERVRAGPEIWVATGTLIGGNIDRINTTQVVPIINNISFPHIEILVRDYEYNAGANVLTGTWEDFSTFDIQLVDRGAPYNPVIENIKFTIIPEPASLALLGFGVISLRKRIRRRSHF